MAGLGKDPRHWDGAPAKTERRNACLLACLLLVVSQISGERGVVIYTWQSFQSFPFGWKFSPLLCQKLDNGLVKTAVGILPVLHFVYLDDILIVGPQGFVRQAVRRATWHLQQAEFVMSAKLELHPCREMDFVGKVPNHHVTLGTAIHPQRECAAPIEGGLLPDHPPGGVRGDRGRCLMLVLQIALPRLHPSEGMVDTG